MSSIVQSIQRKGSRSGRLGSSSSSSLPLSQPSYPTETRTTPPAATPPSATDPQPMQLRRRLSSLSLNFHPNNLPQTSSSAYTWAVHRSKSLSSMGENAGTSVKMWWDWGWSWILSRKPGFAQDLEMNEDEMKRFGSQGKGSWMHVLYKVRNEFRKLIRSEDNVSLPTSYRYDNDGGKKLYRNGA